VHLKLKIRKVLVSLCLAGTAVSCVPFVVQASPLQQTQASGEKQKKSTKKYGASSDDSAENSTVNTDVKASKSWAVSSKNVQSDALASVEMSLVRVEERLAHAQNKAEKETLLAARDGLLAAMQGLRQQKANTNIPVYTADEVARAELIGARAELSDALGDVEMEIGPNGEITGFRVRSLEQGAYALDPAQQLEALIKAEQELKQARLELERKLAKSEAQPKNNR